MSQITTHVLDTARGVPAQGIALELLQQQNSTWLSIAKGVTNQDGRVAGLLAQDRKLESGIYRMHFDTKDYLQRHFDKGFYPYVDVVFELGADGSHYHIPLLLSPYGYSTYRGS